MGSDKENSKSTYVSLLGIDECKKIVQSLTNEAVNALKVFDADSSSLKNMAYQLANRSN